jgi:hypothetical protein
MSETDATDLGHVALPQELQQAIKTFKDWTSQHLLSEQNNSTITETLYHYIDVRGLKGILESGQIWFTDKKREVLKPRFSASTIWLAAQISTSASQMVAMPCSGTA